MLSNKEKNNAHYETIISNKAEFKGDLHFSGGLQVEGRVVGNIIADESSQALVRITDTAVVEGEIRVPNIIINGHVSGNVYSSQHIELAKKAVVTGDVYYTMMEMVMGAQVNGGLIHQADVKGKKGRKAEPKATAPEAAE